MSNMTLNQANINQVADELRTLLNGEFSIKSEFYIDTPYPREEFILKASIYSRWTNEPFDEPIRVKNNFIQFSAGGYCWMFGARPDDIDDSDNYNYPHMEFQEDRVIITQYAPADKGYLHRHTFQKY